jgi:hypothetical protein
MSDDEFMAAYEKSKARAGELKQKMDASPLFEHWSFVNFPVNSKLISTKHKFAVAGKEMECSLLGADETWFKLFEIELLNGRVWDNNVDNYFSYNAVVTENTLKQFGIADYRETLMQPYRRVWWASNRGDEMKTNPPYRIVGVVKDFYIEHLSQQSEPAVFYFTDVSLSAPVMASFAPERRQEVIEFMKNLHDELVGGEFTYSFIEDEIAAMYKDDKKVAMICTVFTGIAILISMIGLFGISLFDIRQRRKEIAIQKINGAQIIDIVRLLVKKYFVLLGLAFAASIPAALGVTVAISLSTLLYQTYRAGNENPANALNN